MNPLPLAPLLLGAILLSGCGPTRETGSPPPGDDLRIAVSIPPQATFVKTLLGEETDVQILVPPGSSPATYEPTPGQMRDLASASVYFAIGVPFEQVWLPRFANAHPGLNIVHTEQAVERMPLESAPLEDPAHDHAHSHHGHAHHDHTHAPGAPDPHIWLSPRLAPRLTAAMAEALIDLAPDQAARIRTRQEAFVREADALHTELLSLFQGLQDRAFLVFHPSWGYFARDFDLEQIPVEVGGQEPSPAELARFVDLVRERNLDTLFVQPEFSRRTAEVLARETGLQLVSLSPLSPDWSGTLRQAARALALRPASP